MSKLGFEALLLVLFVVLAFVSSQDESIDSLDCPFLCECSGNDVNCTNTDIFPDNIPVETQRFFISDSTLDFIPINSFQSNPNLLEIVFTECRIQKIRACAFAELEFLDGISFYNSYIGKIEGNAFSNLVNISMILFDNTQIDEISSFSFHNIKNVDHMEFHRATISTIHPFAFLSFTNVHEIGFGSSSIHRFLKDGISRIKDTSVLYMSSVVINEWQCGIVATTDETGTDLLVTQSNFTCDCKLAWLWNKHPKSSIFGKRSINRCIGTGSFLNTVTIDQMCTSNQSYNIGCPDLLPTTPHTCSRSFDSPKEPIEKVTYPTYFTRNDDSDVAMTTRISDGVFVLSLVTVLIIH